MKWVKNLKLLFIVFVSISSVVSAQQSPVDSLWNVLKNEKEDTLKILTLNVLGARLVAMADFKRADTLFQKALALSLMLKSDKNIAYSYRNIGSLYFEQYKDPAALKNFRLALGIDSTLGNKFSSGRDFVDVGATYLHMENYSEALKNFTIGLNLERSSNDTSLIYATYQFLGTFYKKQGKFPEALKYYHQSLTDAKKKGDYIIAGHDYLDIGNLFLDQSDDTDALTSYLAGLEEYKKAGNRNSEGIIYGSIGNVYYAKHNYAEALSYYNKSLEIGMETDDKVSMTNAYGNIGNIYEIEGKYGDALNYQHKSLEIDSGRGDMEGVCADYINIASVLEDQKKEKEAKDYLNQALKIALKLNSSILLQTTYEANAYLDTTLGNFKSAYREYSKFIMYRDSLTNERTNKKIISEQMSYEFDKKQAIEKAEQDNKDAIATTEKKKQKTITISVSIGLILVVVFSGLLFSRFRVTQKQKTIIENQKLLVEEKNKEVLDSITYAKRLQDATLPSLTEIKRVLPHSFVLYKPKDIVAGDFYWMEHINDMIFIAAADCTGHGVPGALVSMVCSNALNRTVKEFKITDPGKILDKVRELVIETFEKSESDVKDGMDISLCSLIKEGEKKKLKWAGAYNPLWIIKNNSLLEIAPDKQPIGKQEGQRPFNTHDLDLNEGDLLYLFTDGYADQFGGPDGKKFKYKQLEKKLLSVSAEPMEKQKEILDQTLKQWKGSLEQLDDILVIGIRV